MHKIVLNTALIVFMVASTANAEHHLQNDHHNHSEHTEAMFMRHHGPTLSSAINNAAREADRARDQYRHPAETLAFFHVAPHMKVGEYSPGGGWYSRLLGLYLGEAGRLVGLFPNANLAAREPQRQQAIRNAAGAFPTQLARWTGLSTNRFAGLTLDNVAEDEIGTFDRILVIRALHGRIRDGIADSEIRAMRSLLKNGGMIGIVQHRAKANAPFSYANGSRGYLREADVIAFMQVHGFTLVSSSEVNANTNDPANHARGVWEMPPVLSTNRRDLVGLGESDRMTLLFRKSD